MSLGFDPIISNFFFSLSLIPHLSKPQKGQCSPIILKNPPYISVLMTFYRENREDIDMTVSSIISQTYPKEKLQVLMVVEPDDIETQMHVKKNVKRLFNVGISGRLIKSDGKKRIKPHALNIGIEQARGEICAFYDASDYIEKDQFEKAISLMISGKYDVVQSMVLRHGRSFLSRFLFIDTVFWFRKYLPIILKFAKGIPLSGEGLFIRKNVLQEVGNFPEVLTEDAQMGLILTERNKSFALLDSTIVEKAPKNIRSHITQKLRWYRGYLTCLRSLLSSTLSLKRKIFFLLPFISPISSTLAFLGWILIIGFWSLWLFSSPIEMTIPWMQHPIYENVLYFWALALACVGIPLCIFSYAHTLFKANLGRYSPLLVLAPFYWMFIGFCATYSLFRGTKQWGKTER
jgi:cellulose synthase/poly-beta-1,6-N-acetylglucosamine synthase-like glycosyltransferase